MTELAGSIALLVNVAAAAIAARVAWVYRPFVRRPPRTAHSWAWLAHGVCVGWAASSAISIFWTSKWIAQAFGVHDLAWAISQYGGFFDAVARTALIWAAFAHLVGARRR